MKQGTFYPLLEVRDYRRQVNILGKREFCNFETMTGKSFYCRKIEDVVCGWILRRVKKGQNKNSGGKRTRMWCPEFQSKKQYNWTNLAEYTFIWAVAGLLEYV